jgi:hypothetical protein
MGAVKLSGKLADPEFRKRRAKNAAETRTTLEHYVTKLVEAAPRLSAEQKSRLAIALLPAGASDDREVS